MGWRFWERRPRKLPRRVKVYLVKEFGISPEQMMNLRCSQQKGKFAGRKVVYLEIFDLNRPDQVCFDGYREDGYVYLHPKKRV